MDAGSALNNATQRIGRLEARLLLQQVTGFTASQLLAHPEALLDAPALTRYETLVHRRTQGEPLAYLIGQREFYGRDFYVAPGVLIPRPETELLVEQGLDKITAIAAPRILDLGCGSGCIGITLALERPAAHVQALDASPDALTIAQRNAQQLGARIELLESNWFSCLAHQSESKHYHLIVSNPPYIATNDPHLQQGDLRFEPASALSSGTDGLDAIRQIIATAPHHLQPGGWLLLEHGYDQAATVHALLTAAGYTPIEQHRDLAGIIRVSGGQWGL